MEFIHDDILYTEDVIRIKTISEISTIGESLEKNQQLEDALNLYKFAVKLFDDCPQRREIIMKINKLGAQLGTHNQKMNIAADSIADDNAFADNVIQNLRCPRCEKTFKLLVEKCPYCSNPVVEKINKWLNYHRMSSKLSSISLILSFITFIILIFTIADPNINSLFVFGTLIFILGSFMFFQSFHNTCAAQIKKFDPDQSINIFGLLAGIAAVVVGSHIIHSFVDSASSVHIGVNDFRDINIDSINTVDSSNFVDHSTFTGMHVDPNDTISVFDNSFDKTTGILNVDNINAASDQTAFVHNNTGGLESYSEIHGNHVTISDTVGMPVEDIDINGSMGHVKDNLGMTTGYIDSLPTHTTLIQDHLGITDFSISSNGSIYDRQGILQGTISKADKMLVIKDRYGIVLSTIS